MKHLSLEIVEATELASLAAFRHAGSGDKLLIDKAATDAMRSRLNAINFNGMIVLGEGIKDKAPGLFAGEWVGCDNTSSPLIQIATDPVDGTTQLSKWGSESMSIIALGKSLFATEAHYMNKLAVGPKIAKKFRPAIKQPIEEIVETIRKILNREVKVCVMDRPRHTELIAKLRACGCSIRLIQDCDVSGAITAILPENEIDLFVGIGGATEGVLAAVAVRCLGGHFEGQIVDDKTYQNVDDKFYTHHELATGDVMFVATGILNGNLLRGIERRGESFVTHSILMESKTNSFKKIESYHG